MLPSNEHFQFQFQKVMKRKCFSVLTSLKKNLMTKCIDENNSLQLKRIKYE